MKKECECRGALDGGESTSVAAVLKFRSLGSSGSAQAEQGLASAGESRAEGGVYPKQSHETSKQTKHQASALILMARLRCWWNGQR